MENKTTIKSQLVKSWHLPTSTVTEFKEKQTKYCLIIPMINEGEKFIKQLGRMKPFTGLIDIIIADGGSTDGSTNKKILKANGVRTLLIKTSPGRQGTQLRMGFAYALQEGYAGIITVDGNGKDGVDAIPAFIQSLEEGFDFVQGSRFIKGGKAINTPPVRYWAIRLIHAPMISLAAHYWYTDTTNGFRAHSKRYLLHPKVKPFRDIFVRYEFLFYLSVRAPRLGLKVKEIPVTRQYPKGKVPTKITGFRQNFDLIIVLVKLLFGNYNP
jgi:dolichol-phosphate mannosyltransferase